jgi:hypothetical protein
MYLEFAKRLDCGAFTAAFGGPTPLAEDSPSANAGAYSRVRQFFVLCPISGDP